MLFNLLIAKAHHSKPKVLIIIVKLLLHKSIAKNISANPPEIYYCLIVNQNYQFNESWLDSFNRLDRTSCQIKKTPINSQLNQKYCKLFELKTFDYLAINSALKSPDSLLNLAKGNFESKIVDTLIDRLNQPSPLQQEIITKAVYSKNLMPIDIISSFDISEKKRHKLIATIKQTITRKAKIKFKLVIDSKSKIELCTKEFKIYWNLKHYLIEVQTAQNN